jgi:hypothetical protein
VEAKTGPALPTIRVVAGAFGMEEATSIPTDECSESIQAPANQGMATQWRGMNMNRLEVKKGGEQMFIDDELRKVLCENAKRLGVSASVLLNWARACPETDLRRGAIELLRRGLIEIVSIEKDDMICALTAVGKTRADEMSVGGPGGRSFSDAVVPRSRRLVH